MTNQAPLSPAAQAVLDAYRSTHLSINNLAAALRAAADQLKLEAPLGDTDADAVVFAANHAIYTQLLAIAAELGGVSA